MPPRLSLRPLTGGSHPLRRYTAASTTPSICLFCSLSERNLSRRTRRRPLSTRRNQSTSKPAPVRTSDARKDLYDALRGLQKHAVNYVNLSRVQLALNALRQEAGDETVRVAILGLANASEPGSTAKEILRLLLADPLSPQQEWERELLGHDINKPLIVRVGTAHHLEGSDTEEGNLTYAKGGLLKELNVSSPGLNGNRLEFLLMTSNPLSDASELATQKFEEAALVPTVEIPTSSTGRFTPVTTPVHRALLVGDGLVGAASLINSPVFHHDQTIMGVVNLPGLVAEGDAGLPFIAVDVKTAGQGVHDIRQSVDKAFGYEKLWFKSNMPAIQAWLKEGATTTDNNTTKGAVRSLIASVLSNTRDAIGQEEVRRLSAASSSLASPRAIVTLNKALADWSEKAHAELQGEMDRAFSSRRWSKLNWWKLFWRVDDVGVLSSEMLSQRFLPRAERNVIYLAGQIDGSELLGADHRKTAYSLPSLLSAPKPTSPSDDFTTIAQAIPASLSSGTKWPTHIAFTRNYLQSETIPALQALAQKLVFQSASFSGLTTALGALMYLSSFGISESGAVAAFGIIWSLRRLQKKWETAREYWQSEVREEGRKAVRAVEISVGEALDKVTRKSSEGLDESQLKDLRTASELIQKAEEALERLE